MWGVDASPNPDTRYFWRRQTNASYTRGITSVEDGWPNYDFAFRTLGNLCYSNITTVPTTTTIITNSTIITSTVTNITETSSTTTGSDTSLTVTTDFLTFGIFMLAICPLALFWIRRKRNGQ
ncbi:MAG: hypothetical protein ACFFBD_05990 [Candidatus Hodarchaeota archaeon]